MKSTKRISQQVSKLEQKGDTYRAVLGDGAGNVTVPGTRWMCYARIGGRHTPIVLRNTRTPHTEGYVVSVGKDKINKNIFQVLGSWDDGAVETTNNGGIGLHAQNHLLGGSDPVWLLSKQIIELVVYPYSGLIVAINPGIAPAETGGFLRVDGTTVDLTSHLPGTDEMIFVLIQVTPAGIIDVKDGTAFNPADFDLSYIPAQDPGYYALAAVRLYDGQTTITANVTDPDIFDLRFIQAGWDGIYQGEAETDGTWLIIKSGDNLVVQRRESGSYVTMLTIGDDAKLTIGSGEAGVDYQMVVNGETSDLTLTYMEDEDYLKTSAVLRDATAKHRRYYHMPLFSSAPGGSGATYTAPGANTPGGYQLDAAGEVLHMEVDVHGDWDGASDPVVEVHFQVNVNNTGGGVGDTVDLKLICYYMGDGDTATKTQTVEVATVVGQAAQYTAFEVELPIDFDAGGAVVDAGDVFGFILNLETDTSEVDNIIVTNVAFYYDTTHIGIESGDT